MYQRQRGFSLIELCITVAIAALIMTVGVPSFQSMSSENHASAHLDEFNNALRLTRHLAVEHSRNAKLCPRTASSDPTAVPTCSASASDWGNGWVVMLQDESGDYADIMTSAHGEDSSSWVVINDSSVNTINTVVFGPTGTLRPPSSPSVTITIGQNGCNKITQVALTGSLTYNAFGCEG